MERFRVTGRARDAGPLARGPCSRTGFQLVETGDPVPLARHMGEWGDLLELRVTPVLEDAEAAAALPEG